MTSDRLEPLVISLADDLHEAMNLLRCPCGRHRLTKERVARVERELREMAR